MVRRLVGAIVEAVAAEGLDPRRRRLVPLGPLGPRDLPVGHLAHQRMCEGELRLAGDHAPALATDELLAHELLELRVELCSCAEGAAPEHAPEDGCVLQKSLLALRERVEARGDDPVQRLGELVRPALGGDADELFREERVAADPRQQLCLLVCRQ